MFGRVVFDRTSPTIGSFRPDDPWSPPPRRFGYHRTRLHEHYEVARDPNRPPEIRYRARQAMAALVQSIKPPPNVETICCRTFKPYAGPMPQGVAA